MSIDVNYENIKTLEQALNVIQKLARGLNNCYQSGFYVCPKCGERQTEEKTVFENEQLQKLLDHLVEKKKYDKAHS